MIYKIWKSIRNSLLTTKSYMGIEISDYSVKVVLLSHINSNNTRLVAYTIEPIDEQCIDEGKIVDSFRLMQIVQSAVNKLDITPKKAHFALPSPLVMVRFLKLPDLAKKEMNKLVDFEMKHNIHLPFDQPFYDYLKLNGQDENQLKKQHSKSKRRASKSINDSQQSVAAAVDPLFGITSDKNANTLATETASENLCDIMLVAAPREHVEEYVQIIRDAHIVVSSVEIKPLSLYRTILKLDNNDTITHQTFLLVDLGRTASDVSIFHEGQLKITRNIYINFPQEKDSKGELDKDDLLSILHITGGNNDFINACNELVHELERLINFYRYTLNHRDHQFERVIISGDIERIEEVRSIVEERLSTKVTIISSGHIETQESDLNVIFPSIATAFGLALRGNSD